MKSVMLLLMFLPGFCLAQDFDISSIPMKDGDIYYDFVEKVDSAVTADQLYVRAKVFFAKAFNKSKEVIQLDDKENGVIIGKGNADVAYNNGINISTYNYKFTLEIAVKHGRYRVKMYDFETQFLYNHYKTAKNGGFGSKASKRFIQGLADKNIALFALIKSEMSQGSDKSEW